MNEEHFRFYWLYILDLKNLLIEKKLGQVYIVAILSICMRLIFKTTRLQTQHVLRGKV